jgi:CheY-like chemotaxis protein
MFIRSCVDRRRKMGHLLSLIDKTPPSLPPGSSEPPLPQTRSIKAAPKSALLVEDHESLSNFLKTSLLKEGYTVRVASSSEEGLRLYRDFGPFNVVLINYYVPERNGACIDPLAPQTKGVELALAIRSIDSTQGVILGAFAFRTAAEVPRAREAMDIPLLLDHRRLKGLLEKIEVDLAIKVLSSADLGRLQQIARLLLRNIGRAARGRDWEDLLGEALCRTLIGAEDVQNGRHWNRSVPFAQHLAGAMKSIASLWKRQFREQETYSASELTIYDAEGQEHSPFDTVRSRSASPDQHLMEKDEEDRILAMFSDDAEATLVLNGWMDGLNKNEIMARGGLEAKKYAATRKRIRWKLLARAKEGGQE